MASDSVYGTDCTENYIGTPKEVSVTVLKTGKVLFNNAVELPKDSDGMENSVDPH